MKALVVMKLEPLQERFKELNEIIEEEVVRLERYPI
jgi:hypothetical protein